MSAKRLPRPASAIPVVRSERNRQGDAVSDSDLLSIKDRSIVVIDPKGELAAVTAAYRRTVGDVVMLNPFNVLGLGSAGFNPLAMLDPKSPEFL